MNKCIKIISIILIILILSVCISNICFASSDPIENPNFYEPDTSTLAKDSKKLVEIGNIIVGSIRATGTVIVVIALMVIGLRYMFGSTEERANYKETMVPYLIGAVMIFTIPNLLGIVYDLVKSINF